MNLEFRVTARIPDKSPDWASSLTVDFARNAALQIDSALARLWPLIPWKTVAVTPNDAPPSVALSTGDPRFDPAAPLTVNGYRFIAAPPEAASLLTEEEMAATVRDCVAPAYTKPEPPPIQPVPSWSTCRPGRREGDEYICPKPGCGLRWSVDEDRPGCPL